LPAGGSQDKYPVAYFGTIRLQSAAFQTGKVKGRNNKKDIFEESKFLLPNSFLTTVWF